MKKILFAAGIFALSFLIMSNTTTLYSKANLFPEVEKFYKSVQAMPPNTGHNSTLNYLSQCIMQGMTSDKKIDLLFTCSDNTFRSLAAQLVLQSMLSLHKYNKLVVSSCGYQNGEVNNAFINILTKHGFHILPKGTAVNGKKSYEVTFGDNMPPVIIYAKQLDDPAIPKTMFMQVKMCSSDQASCIDMPGARFKESLPFDNTSLPISEEDLDKEFSSITSEILYAFNKTQQ